MYIQWLCLQKCEIHFQGFSTVSSFSKIKDLFMHVLTVCITISCIIFHFFLASLVELTTSWHDREQISSNWTSKDILKLLLAYSDAEIYWQDSACFLNHIHHLSQIKTCLTGNAVNMCMVKQNPCVIMNSATKTEQNHLPGHFSPALYSLLVKNGGGLTVG